MNTRRVDHLQRTTMAIAVSLVCAAGFMACAPAFAGDGNASNPASTAVPTPTVAAANPQDATTTPTEKPKTLATTMVTAQKREQPAIDVPGSVTSIDSSALSSGGQDRLADYAAQVPGMSVTSVAPGRTQVIIRGITTGLGQSAPTTSIYIDDAPVGSVNAYGGGSVLTPDIDPADLERIEVLKGPQGTLYGAGAVGGLLRYVTNPPDFQNTHVSVTAGGDDIDHGGVGSLGRLYVNLPFDNNTMALQASGFDRYEPGFIDDVNGRKHVNTSRTKGGRLAYTWLLNSNWKVAASALTQRVNNNDNPAQDVDGKSLQPLFGSLKQNVYVPQPTDTEINLYNLTVHGQIGNFQLVSSTTYQNIYSNSTADDSYVFNSLLGPSLPIPDIGSRILTATDTARWSQELRLDSTALDEKLQYEFGVYFTKEQDTNRTLGVEPFNTITLAPIPLPFNVFSGGLGSTYREYSGFANATYQFTPKFSVQAGIRYSEDHQVYEQNYNGIILGPEPVVVNDAKEQGSKSTYLVTASYAATENDELYARVATGYRPGGPNALIPAIIYPAPKTFAPDSLTSYEIGYKTVMDDGNVSFETALFTTHWKDIQILTTQGGFSFFVNGGTATSKGGEATLVFYPVSGMDIRASFAYTDAALTSDAPIAGGVKGDELPFVPKITGSLSSGYHWAVAGGWEASIGGSFDYIGKRQSDYSLRDPVTVPSYATLNANFSMKRDRWRFTLYGKNLTDREGIIYLATRNAVPGLNPYSASLIQPRTLGVEVNYAF